MRNPHIASWYQQLGLTAPTSSPVRTFDHDGEVQSGSVNPRAWAPKHGDVAAATYAMEAGTYVE